MFERWQRVKEKGGLLLSSVCIILLVGQFFYPTSFKVVMFDASHTIHQFAEQTSHLKLSSEKQQKLAERFSHVLSVTVEEYAKSHRVVIVKPNIVVSGAPDVTSEIEAMLAKNMQEANQ